MALNVSSPQLSDTSGVRG